jgi:hypothetical protein
MKFDDLDNTFTWLNLKLLPMDVHPFMGRLEYNLFCTKLDLKWMKLIIWMKFDHLNNTFTSMNPKLLPMDVLPFMGRLD